MFCPVMFLIPTKTLKSNKWSAIFIWKLPLDVSLKTQGERHTGKTNMAVYVVFDIMINKVSILFVDEGTVEIMPHLIVWSAPTCSNHSPIHVHAYGFEKPEAFIWIISDAAIMTRGLMVATSCDSFNHQIVFFGNTFNLLLWQ